MWLAFIIRIAFFGLGLALAVPLTEKRQVPTTYDYVVVGSGAGGGPLAARLSIAGFKVLLIDAGDDEGTSYQEQVPALQLLSTEYQPMAWEYFVNHYSDPARQATDTKMTWKTPSGSLYVGTSPPAGSTPLGILYPRSGTLGGCSAHNALITIYPHDSDWTNIQTITGDSSWNPSNMRKYFEKLEQNHYVTQPLFGLIDNGHGYSGWLGTATTSLTLAIQDLKTIALLTAAASAMGRSLLGIFLNTIIGIGQVFLLDPNAPGQSSVPGLYQVPISMLNGKRSSTRDFVLSTANAVNANGSPKYHLDILLKTLVTKVNFDKTVSPPKAIGVNYLSGQSLYRADSRSSSASPTGSGSVNVTKEVILSAGAFNTPQLLKLSGIGPQAELQSFNIPVIVNLPGVGTNLQDRYEASVTATATSDFTITSQCTFLRTPNDPCLQTWISGTDQTSKGTYASNGLAIGAIKKSSAVASGEPDLFIAGGPTNFVGYYPGYSANANIDARHWTWLVLKAHSRNNAGTVKLRSADPRDTPIINFNSFDTGVTTGGADQLDLESLYEGFQYARQIFGDVIGGGFTEQYPGPNVTTEAQAKTFLANEAWGHHASCTCPIGADNDPMAVLDSKFRVRGVKGLRVVDASIFPKIPGFYIALPIYMISEKAADVIINNL